jgi:hypothetical protein
MAQAETDPTRIHDPDDLLRYLTEELGFQKGVAIYAMNQHYHDGQLRLEKQDLIRDGEPYGGWIAIDAKFGDLKLDGDGHVRVVPRIKPWREARYRIAEQCDARTIWPLHSPASETADQQLKDKPGSQESVKSKDGWQVRRLRKALKEKYPPDGHPPVDMTLTAILKSVDAIYKREGWKFASPDTLARLMGRRA